MKFFKTKELILLPVLATFIQCSNPSTPGELSKIKDELNTAKSTIENLKSQIEPEGNLVHIVFFKTKPKADLAALGRAIKKLEGIEVVKDLQYGAFENLEDQRALSNYTMMMEMSFDNKSDYQTYQKHAIHLKLKEEVKSFLAAPPATYDYIKE